MGTLLVHFTHGPEAATRAALGLLVARTALEAGHEVSLFFAGDSVQLLRSSTLDATHGIGTGSAREHFDACVAAGAHAFASGMSSQARGLGAEDIPPTVSFAPPSKLVDLVFSTDKTLVY